MLSICYKENYDNSQKGLTLDRYDVYIASARRAAGVKGRRLNERTHMQ